jgi:ABC-type bacteriocin/lantibiotic exporter with double-glycine peptidase domain
VFLVISGILAALAGVFPPLLFREFLDNVLAGKTCLPAFLAVAVAAAFFAFAVNTLRRLYLLKIEGKFAVSANVGFFQHVLNLPMRFFQQRNAGDIADRQNINQDIASAVLQTLAPQALNAGLAIFYLVVMFRYSKPLALIGMGAALLNLALSFYLSKKRLDIAATEASAGGNFAGSTLSGFRLIETLKASAAEGQFFEKWAAAQAEVHFHDVRMAKTNAVWGKIPVLVRDSANIAVLGIGVFLIMEGKFTVGMLMAFQGFMGAFTAPVQSLVDAGQSIREARAGFERVNDVLSYPPEPKKANPKSEEGIEITHLTFGYAKFSPPVVKDFSLTVPAGKSAAITGPTGCGKSTIISLAAGLYAPWSGQIRLAGSAVCVSQDGQLFDDTIKNNLTLWDAAISMDDIVRAAKDARIHEAIMRRPGGYDFVVRKNGMEFSGGERQRLEIARALACNPRILLLDEATSALDEKTEAAVMTAIRARGITLLVSAHRLSAIRGCDTVISLESGAPS